MKNNEIVRALRCISTAGGENACEHCPYWKEEEVPEEERPIYGADTMHSCDVDRVGLDGADLIEKLTDRLAAYEDTGLMPEEAKRMSNILMDVGIDYNCSWEYVKNWLLDARLREIAEADKDGRLVVLPCKVGDTLWVTGRDNMPREMALEAPDIRAVCTDEDNLCMSTCNRKPDGFCAYRLRNDGADVGKTVFLTREEAEKALEAKSND